MFIMAAAYNTLILLCHSYTEHIVHINTIIVYYEHIVHIDNRAGWTTQCLQAMHSRCV